MLEWIDTKVELPAEGIIVDTKIDDAKGCRFIRFLEWSKIY